jgi:hypothetical protein
MDNTTDPRGTPMRRTTRSAVVNAAVGLTALVSCVLPSSLVVAGSASAATATVTASTVRTAASTTVYSGGVVNLTTSAAAKQAKALATTDPAGAAAAATLAKYPTAMWLGEWTTGSTLVTALQNATAQATAAGRTAVFVTYAIPDRDCGGYSAGGFTEASYDSWVDTIAATLKGTRSTVIVEPDSLAMLAGGNCSASLATQRYRILNREVTAFTAAGVASYLDAGNSNWIKPATMAATLKSAGVANARGFFSNVANYYPVANEVAYDDQVSALLGGKHYVIDTSRDGQGWKGTWCNAPGAGLGETPRVVSNGTALDALLWIKTPGESDGTCNGGPAAGNWYSAYAQALVKNAVLGAPATSTAPASSAAATTIGNLDSVAVVPGGVQVVGWSLDRSKPSSTAAVTITEDRSTVATLSASLSRPDVDRVYGDGAAHGFSGIVRAAAGKHTICAASGGTVLRCIAVSVPAAGPTGHLDSVASTAAGRISVVGWTFDRDAVGSALRVRITTSGATARTTTADRTRTDVGRVYGVGSAHGISITYAVQAGRRKVCATAINIGSGSNTSLGCVTVTVR